jgi:hypothetical protein
MQTCAYQQFGIPACISTNRTSRKHPKHQGWSDQEGVMQQDLSRPLVRRNQFVRTTADLPTSTSTYLPTSASLSLTFCVFNCERGYCKVQHDHGQEVEMQMHPTRGGTQIGGGGGASGFSPGFCESCGSVFDSLDERFCPTCGHARFEIAPASAPAPALASTRGFSSSLAPAPASDPQVQYATVMPPPSVGGSDATRCAIPFLIYDIPFSYNDYYLGGER